MWTLERKSPILHEPDISFKEGYFMLFHYSGPPRRITLEAQVRQFLLFPSYIYRHDSSEDFGTDEEIQASPSHHY